MVISKKSQKVLILLLIFRWKKLVFFLNLIIYCLQIMPENLQPLHGNSPPQENSTMENFPTTTFVQFYPSNKFPQKVSFSRFRQKNYPINTLIRKKYLFLFNFWSFSIHAFPTLKILPRVLPAPPYIGKFLQRKICPWRIIPGDNSPWRISTVENE